MSASTLWLPAALLALAACVGSEEVGSGQGELAGGAAPGRPSIRPQAALISCAGRCVDVEHCTAAVLSETRIVTAAHCLEDLGWETTRYEHSAKLDVNSIATDWEGLTLLAGSDITTATSRAIIYDEEADANKLRYVPTPTSDAPSQVAELEHGFGTFLAATWEHDGDSRRAALYAFSTPEALAGATRHVLGRGEPTAMRALSGHGKHVLVALRRDFDVQGSAKGRKFATVVDIELTDAGAAGHNVFHGLEDVEVSSIVQLNAETALLGGSRIGPTGPVPFVWAYHRQPSEGASPGWQPWTQVMQFAIPPELGVLRMLAVGDSGMYGLFVGSQVTTVAQLGLTGIVTREGSEEPTSFTLSPEHLKKHYAFHSDGSSPFSSSSKDPSFSPVGISILGNRIILSGTTRHAGKMTPTHIGLTSDLLLDEKFEIGGVAPVDGIATDEEKKGHRLRAVIANGESLTTVGGRPVALGTTKIVRTTYDKNLVPELSVRGVQIGMNRKFASGVDLAEAELVSPLAGAPALPIGSMTAELTCIGGGSGGLYEGEIRLKFPGSPKNYADSTSSRVYADGGDSGGPCLDAEGKLAGIIVAGAEDKNDEGLTEGNITILTETALRSFLP